MSQDQDRFCKRCSVSRVNALCEAYEKAHQPGGEATLSKLRNIIKLATQKDYAMASRLLTPGLKPQELRALCFNVSSFLTDEDVKLILG